MKYIKKIYKPIIVLVILVIAAVALFGGVTIKTEGYSVDNVYNTIKELSSDKYQGRRYGTQGNMDAVNYVADQFRNIGLEPAGDDNTYLRKYAENVRTYNGIAVLDLLDSSGKVIKQYKYGEDFIEQSYGFSGPGDVTSGFAFMDYTGESLVDKPVNDNYIAIVNVSSRSQRIMDNLAFALMRGENEYKGLITAVPDDTNLRQDSASLGSRSSHKSGYEMPSLIVKDYVSKELMTFKDKGYKLHIKSTFDCEPSGTADVMGMIPANSEDYLLITSHIDNVGPLSDGIIYQGALDDASGVGAMIEIARFIKSQGKAPSKNLVFIAFNGTDGGMLGSGGYVSKYMSQLYNTSVINLDMIGTGGSKELDLIYNTIYNPGIDANMDPSSKMRYHMKNIAEALNIPAKEMNDVLTDNIVFSQLGVPAITISNYDKNLTRTPSDTLEKVDKNIIDGDMKLATNFIAITAYSNLSAGGYSVFLAEAQNLIRSLYPYVAALVLSIIIFLFILHRKKKTGNDRPGKVPYITIIVMIILMGIVCYFPIQYPYAPSPNLDILGFLGQGLINIALSVVVIMPIYFASAILGVFIIYFGKRRMKNPKYEGNGSEIKYYYYVAMILVVLTSVMLALLYDAPQYLAVTPDFARYTSGKIVLYLCLAVIAYFVTRMAGREIEVKPKTYKSLVVFAVIFFMLLSSFYMPIATNKYVMDQNFGQANITSSAYTGGFGE